jgi:hypothetical protein
MDFEPIELQRTIYRAQEEEHRYIISLNVAPSEEWTAAFEDFNWGMVTTTAPKVVAWGIAVPNPTRQFLDRLPDATRRTNEGESQRVAALPPDAKAVYEAWFDDQTAK